MARQRAAPCAGKRVADLGTEGAVVSRVTVSGSCFLRPRLGVCARDEKDQLFLFDRIYRLFWSVFALAGISVSGGDQDDARTGGCGTSFGMVATDQKQSAGDFAACILSPNVISTPRCAGRYRSRFHDYDRSVERILVRSNWETTGMTWLSRASPSDRACPAYAPFRSASIRSSVNGAG